MSNRSNIPYHTVDQLEELITHGKSCATRMLALQKLKGKYCNKELVNKLRDLQELINR
jgi:hypothetical protein